ncbi:MAG: hypothetical protein AB1730_06765 [Myxococcota bacterium]
MKWISLRSARDFTPLPPFASWIQHPRIRNTDRRPRAATYAAHHDRPLRRARRVEDHAARVRRAALDLDDVSRRERRQLRELAVPRRRARPRDVRVLLTTLVRDRSAVVARIASAASRRKWWPNSGRLSVEKFPTQEQSRNRPGAPARIRLGNGGSEA